MTLDLKAILNKKRVSNVTRSSSHTGAHCYEKVITPKDKVQYICSLPKCNHSLNIPQWIVGKENLCKVCFVAFIVSEDLSLLCDDCNEASKVTESGIQ